MVTPVQTTMDDVLRKATRGKDPRVARMIAILRAVDGWCTAAHFKRTMDWSDRLCRELANQSRGWILSGNKGYLYTPHATVTDFTECNGRIYSQGKRMLQRAVEQQRVYHKQGRRP